MLKDDGASRRRTLNARFRARRADHSCYTLFFLKKQDKHKLDLNKDIFLQ